MNTVFKTLLAGGLAAMALATGPGAQAEPPRAAFARPAGEAHVAGPTVLASIMQHARLQSRAARPVTHTLDVPYGIALDAAGNLYVANLFAGVTIYNEKEQYLGQITAGLSNPAAVGINFEGYILVANNSSGSISVFSPSWSPAGTIADPKLTFPTSLYIDPDDTVWVLDSSGTLHGYLANSAILPTLATGGSAVGPWGPNVTVWGIPNPTGNYDEDFQNRGAAVRDNPSLNASFPDGSPLAAGETQDSAGQQYVTDYAHDQVQIWSSNALYLNGIINTPSAPAGIAVDSAHNRIYVSLPNASEVIVYDKTAPFKELKVIY